VALDYIIENLFELSSSFDPHASQCLPLYLDFILDMPSYSNNYSKWDALEVRFIIVANDRSGWNGS
jgi:hypothetical protein